MSNTLQSILENEVNFIRVKLEKSKTSRPKIKRMKLNDKNSQIIMNALQKELQEGRKVIREGTEISISDTLYIRVSDIYHGYNPQSLSNYTDIEVWIRKK